MSIPLTPVSLAGVNVGQTGPLDWTGLIQSGTPIGTQAGQPTLRLFNESNCGLQINLSGVQGSVLPAGGWGDIALTGQNSLTWTVLYILAGPSPNTLIGVLYEPGETVPAMPILGNSAVGIGGTVATSTSSSLKNDGNGPGLTIIESTPSDQVASSLNIDNDGSGFWKVLSAGVLRIVLSIVRGNASALKAQIQFGDAGDTSITTFYGTVGAGSVVPVATLAAGALPSGVTIPGGQVTGDIAANQVGPGALDTDVTMNAPEVQPGTFPVGTFAMQTNTRFTGFQLENTVDPGGNTQDLLELSRVGTAANNITLGIDANGGLYFFDSDASAFAAQSVRAVFNNSAAGPLLVGRSNGGGNIGAHIWGGTSDPAALAAEGDFWAEK